MEIVRLSVNLNRQKEGRKMNTVLEFDEETGEYYSRRATEFDGYDPVNEESEETSCNWDYMK